VVKGGTLAAGWENGVLNGNEVLYDQPIRIGSDVKASTTDPGTKALMKVPIAFSCNLLDSASC
ncbi:hypothetical protein P8631_23495, partial [Guyparkeria sp. 1SP6A2]|nr:hypothetical protein [Guyparkeria sp. 1SP6A2]